MELTVRPWQLDRPAAARAYEALLTHFPHLALADVARDLARPLTHSRLPYPWFTAPPPLRPTIDR